MSKAYDLSKITVQRPKPKKVIIKFISPYNINNVVYEI